MHSENLHSLAGSARRFLTRTLLSVAGACLLAAPAQAAPSEFNVLHRFGAEVTPGSSAGMGPVSPPVLGRDGKLYGLLTTTYFRNLDGSFVSPIFKDPVTGESFTDLGCVFYRVDPATGSYQTLAEFEALAPRVDVAGYYPAGDRSSFCSAPVQASNGDWYGNTFSGGANHTGRIWRYSGGNQVETVYSFPALTGPRAGGIMPGLPLLKGADDTFYGATQKGGANDSGTVFKFRADTGYSLLHDFAPWTLGAADPGGNWQYSNASSSLALILSRDGKSLYGTSSESWSKKGSQLTRLNQSSLFRVGTDGSGFTQLAAYPSNDLYFFAPTSIVQAPGSDDLIGVSERSNNESDLAQFFRFHADTGITDRQSQTLPENTPAGGLYPQGLFLAPDGQVYGTLFIGGSERSGSVFRLKPDGSHEVIYVLAPPSGTNWPEGARPDGGFLSMGPNGELYGITDAGTDEGAGVRGVLFSIKPGDRIAPGITLGLAGSGLSTNVPNYPDPYTIVLGQTASLRWGSVQAQNCVGGADWPAPGSIATSGAITIKPTAVGNYVYTVNCENVDAPGQVFSASLAVKVLPVETPVQQVGNGSGGGSTSWWLMLPLLLLALARAVAATPAFQPDSKHSSRS